LEDKKMRRGYDSEFLIDENGVLLGINLGADFTSEHEWGIKGIKDVFGLKDEQANFFGIKKPLYGVERRKINNKVDLLFKEVIVNKEKCMVLILDRWSKQYAEESKDNKWIPNDLNIYRDEKMACAWDERSFGIMVKEDYFKELTEIYNAFMNLDIVIGISPSHAFKNGGLIFTIASRLPKETVEEIYNNDLDAIRLKEAAEATGIYELLEKAGKGKYKGWMALSPRWKDDEKKEVIFWLNPEHQNIHNFGWFTVEDLKEWAENKGKIMMSKK
jgi:hypothetical protein